jgi:hypothetical protein
METATESRIRGCAVLGVSPQPWPVIDVNDELEQIERSFLIVARMKSLRTRVVVMLGMFCLEKLKDSEQIEKECRQEVLTPESR